MQITVSGKQVDLSDALRVRVSDQLTLVAGKYFDHALDAHVTFGRARSFFTCDINLHAGRGLTLRGEGEAADANSAFDDAAEHIATRLRRYRNRVSEHHRDLANRTPQTARTVVLHSDPEETETPEPGNDTASNGKSSEFATIVAETASSIDRLSVGEAVMRMDLAHQPVLMFRNSTSGELNVIYRRPDGHIGWIDPAAM